MVSLDKKGNPTPSWKDKRYAKAFKEQAAEIERLSDDVDAYQQHEDEIIVALGSRGILPSDIVKEIERLAARNELLEAVLEAAEKQLAMLDGIDRTAKYIGLIKAIAAVQVKP